MEFPDSLYRRIKFTWGGYENYTVFLSFVPGLSRIYVPIVYGIKSPKEAQEIAHRGNAALKEWASELLADDAVVNPERIYWSKDADLEHLPEMTEATPEQLKNIEIERNAKGEIVGMKVARGEIHDRP